MRAPALDSDDHTIRVVTARTAPSAIAELARPLSPTALLDAPASRDSAIV